MPLPWHGKRAPHDCDAPHDHLPLQRLGRAGRHRPRRHHQPHRHGLRNRRLQHPLARGDFNRRRTVHQLPHDHPHAAHRPFRRLPPPHGHIGRAGAPQTRTDSLTTYDTSTSIETETVTSATAPTVIRRSLHGVLLSTETSGETTFNSYDAFARVAYTSTTTVIVITLQSSCAGLIEIR